MKTTRIRDTAVHVSDMGLGTAQLGDLYAQAQARLAEIVPAVPLHENHTLLAYRRSLRGLIFDTSHNVPFLTTAWLAETRS